jgi:hypothetical protein
MIEALGFHRGKWGFNWVVGVACMGVQWVYEVIRGDLLADRGEGEVLLSCKVWRVLRGIVWGYEYKYSVFGNSVGIIWNM